jgi:surface antigen
MRKPAVNSIAIAMLLLVPLTGCQTVSESPKTAIGGLGGGATGGLIAAAAGAGGAGIAAGVIGGILVGGLVGNLLDQRDRDLQAKAAAQALEKTSSGTPVVWQNPDNGHAGTITPTRTYQTAQGTYCREYQQTVTIDGKKENSHGTACRQPDGSWKLAD